MRYAREAQMVVEERAFTIAEAQDADEAFTTSASAFVMPVIEIDGVTLGDGKPGRASHCVCVRSILKKAGKQRSKKPALSLAKQSRRYL